MSEIYNRIEHLLRLAEDDRATPAERESARAFYDKLVEKYPGYRDQKTRQDQVVTEVDLRYSKSYQAVLLARLASFCGCEAWTLRRPYSGKKINQLRIKGPEVMVALVQELYTELRRKQSEAIAAFGLGFAWAAVPWIPEDDAEPKSNTRKRRLTEEQYRVIELGLKAGKDHVVKGPHEMLPEHEG